MTVMTGVTRGTRVTTRRRGVTKGLRWGLRRGVRRKGTRRLRKGVPGARMRPVNPPLPTQGGVVSVSRLAKGVAGGRFIGLTGLTGLTNHQVIRHRPAK